MNGHLDSVDDFIPYCYRSRITNMVDADTFDVEVDLGFNIAHEFRVRPLDIDAAEIHFVRHDSEEYAMGIEQTEWVREWFLEGEENWTEDDWPFVLDTERDNTGKYGRYLAYVYRRSDGEELTVAFLDHYGEEFEY